MCFFKFYLYPLQHGLRGGLVFPAVSADRDNHLKGTLLVRAEINIDPELESAWFQTLNLKCDFLVSKLSSKCNLYCYITATMLTLSHWWGGAS
jgi:hypothetical protein